MRKRLSPYLVALPGLIVLLVFKVWPVIWSFVLSLWKFNPRIGLSPSTYVGISNYSDLFGNEYVRKLLPNTIILTILPAAILSIAAFLGVMCIRHLPAGWLKTAVLCIIAVPSFIPKQLFFNVVIYISDLISDMVRITDKSGHIRLSLVAAPEYYPIVYSICETARYVFYPIFLGVLATDGIRGKYIMRLLRIVIAFFLIRCTSFLLMDPEMVTAIYNSMTFETGDTITAFSYRKGMHEFNYGFASAMDSLRITVQTCINIGIFLAIIKFIPKKEDRICIINGKSGLPCKILSIFGCIVLCAVTAGIALLIARGISQASVQLKPALLYRGFPIALSNSFIYSTGAALVFTLLSVFLAYPMKNEQKWYKMILFLLLFTRGITAEYLFYRKLGLIDTAVGAILFSGISVIGAWVIYFMTYRSKAPIACFRDYMKNLYPSLVIVFLLGFMLTWNSNICIKMQILQSSRNYPVTEMIHSYFLYISTKVLTDLSPEQEIAAKTIQALISALPPMAAGWTLVLFAKKIFKNPTV